jgi:hypothetical protein
VPSGRPCGLMQVRSGFSEAVMSQGLQILPWFDRRLESFPISLHVFEQLPITLDAKFALSLQTFFVSYRTQAVLWSVLQRHSGQAGTKYKRDGAPPGKVAIGYSGQSITIFQRSSLKPWS